MKQNYFELFQLPIGFAIDEADLALRHRAIIDKVHPDRFAAKSAMEQRLALQWATFANEAFDALRDPIARAKYLLTLNAPELTGDHVRVNLPQTFLMQQMQWREDLDDAGHDEQALLALNRQIVVARDALQAALNQDFADEQWENAANHVREGRFIHKLLQQIKQALP